MRRHDGKRRGAWGSPAFLYRERRSRHMAFYIVDGTVFECDGSAEEVLATLDRLNADAGVDGYPVSDALRASCVARVACEGVSELPARRWPRRVLTLAESHTGGLYVTDGAGDWYCEQCGDWDEPVGSWLDGDDEAAVEVAAKAFDGFPSDLADLMFELRETGGDLAEIVEDCCGDVACYEGSLVREDGSRVKESALGGFGRLAADLVDATLDGRVDAAVRRRVETRLADWGVDPFDRLRLQERMLEEAGDAAGDRRRFAACFYYDDGDETPGPVWEAFMDLYARVPEGGSDDAGDR